MDITHYLDLTYLGDDKASAMAVIEKTNAIKPKALCISPCFVALAKSMTTLPIATVANFPQGNQSEEAITQQLQQSIKEGADEVDIVFPYQKYLDGNDEQAFLLIKSILNTIPNQVVTKVIIETAVLDKQESIEDICKNLIAYEVNFIKTSTGKMKGAEKASSKTILQAIKNFDKDSRTGFKASGGIRTICDAKSYLSLAETILETPLSPERFRIGASNLQ